MKQILSANFCAIKYQTKNKYIESIDIQSNTK
jgi:hypothetical protein